MLQKIEHEKTWTKYITVHNVHFFWRNSNKILVHEAKHKYITCKDNDK